MNKTQLFLAGYLVVMHFFVLLVLWKSDFIAKTRTWLTAHQVEIKPHYQNMLNMHLRQVDSIPDGATLFVGDSHVESLCVIGVTPMAVNFGISGDTTVGVLQRIDEYMPAIQRAEFVVLAIGINDLNFREPNDIEKNMSLILDKLAESKVLLSSIFPIDESASDRLVGKQARVKLLNVAFAKLASERPNVSFVDNNSALDTDQDGVLDREFHVGDGMHLNDRGYAKWIEKLRGEIEQWRND